MTEQEIIIMEQFRDIPVRCVTIGGKHMIPVVDIANAISMDRSNMSKLLKRNEQFFEDYKGVVNTTTPGGVQQLVCLTRDGVMGLLFKVDAVRSKDPDKRERIIEFQRWATGVLAKEAVKDIEALQIRDDARRLAAPQKLSVTEAINKQLDIADIAIKRSDIPKEIAHKIAWNLAAEEHEELYAYASAIKSKEQPLLTGATSPADQNEYDAYFSLRKVAEILKQPEAKVRNMLESLNITIFKNGMTHLTRYGESFEFGKVFKIMPQFPYSTTERTYIRYTPAAIELLREELKRNGFTSG